MTVRPEQPEHPDHPEPAKPLPAAPLPRLKLPGVSGPSDDDTAHEGGRSRRRGGSDPGLRATDRRGGAARDQRKFVPRRGGG